MTADPRAEGLIRQARALDATARRNKRAADQHRKAAQAAREQQAEIERQCAALGITVTYDHSPGEGTTPWPHNRSSISRR